MRKTVILIAGALLLFAAGCASQREQNVQKFEAMHGELRKQDPAEPQKWEMNPGQPK